MRLLLAYLLALALAGGLGVAPTAAEPRHGIAMHGEPRYPADFAHFDYADPAAKPGGALRLGAVGTFDSLNPLITFGKPAEGIRGYVYESLMERALDEPFTLYGLLAESIETPADRSAVTFTLNPAARFSDGKPVTPEDVLFSWQLLRDHGRPNHREYYKKVVRAEKTGERAVRFAFDRGGDREMPLIMGLMPVLPRHAVDVDSFEKPTLIPPVGSGPYVVAEVDAGRSITYRRNADYWGRNLPVMRGRYNFDSVRFDYYRDANTAFEAFKTGAVHVRSESDPQQWLTGYDFPAAADGRVSRAEFELGIPAGMPALVFNTRRPLFADRRVREAFILLFDFEWINRALYGGLYARAKSFFERSALSSSGVPASARERALLAPFPDAVKPEIMAGTWRPPTSSGDGRNRDNIRAALQLLAEAGYELKDGVLVAVATGTPVAVEVMTRTREQERLLLSYASTLKRAGIALTIRQVDDANYENRRKSFDFDMMQFTWFASLSPGNEQLFRWASNQADIEGSFNLAGVRSPAVDAMIDAMLKAESAEDFVAAVRALDRVLLSGDYVVPLFFLEKQWVAYWSGLAFPARTSLYGYQLDTWWWQ